MSEATNTQVALLAAELRRLRKAHGLTQTQLAERIEYDERTVRNVENNRSTPSEEYVSRWLQWFRDAGGDGGTAARIVGVHARTLSPDEWGWWPPEWGTLGRVGSSPSSDEDLAMERRKILGGVVAVSAAALLPGSAAIDVDGYEQVSRVLRRRYETVPARLLLPRVQTEIDGIDHELKQVAGDDRERLLRVYGELQLAAAWMTRWDLEDLPSAGQHLRLAGLAARDIGDRDLLAHVLSLHALTLRKSKRLGEATQAADTAVRLASSRRPATASYVNLAAAEIYSTTGNERTTRAVLDTARESLPRVTDRSAWRGTGVWSAGRAAAFEGYALRHLGLTEEAKARLDEVFASGTLSGDDARKYRVESETDQAEVSMQLGEPEEAARWASVAYDDAVAAGYPSEIDRVGAVYADLRQGFGPLPEVRELGLRLHA